jgi:hypothetical protein
MVEMAPCVSVIHAEEVEQVVLLGKAGRKIKSCVGCSIAIPAGNKSPVRQQVRRKRLSEDFKRVGHSNVGDTTEARVLSSDR